MLWGGLCLFSSLSTAVWFAAETPLTASVIAEEASVSADVHSVFSTTSFHLQPRFCSRQWFFFSSGFIFWLSLLFNTNWTVHFSPALGFQICGSSVTYNRCFITQWYSQVQVLRLYSSAAWCPVSWVLLLGCCFCSFGSTASTVHFRCSCYFHTHGSFYI